MSSISSNMKLAQDFVFVPNQTDLDFSAFSSNEPYKFLPPEKRHMGISQYEYIGTGGGSFGNGSALLDNGPKEAVDAIQKFLKDNQWFTAPNASRSGFVVTSPITESEVSKSRFLTITANAVSLAEEREAPLFVDRKFRDCFSRTMLNKPACCNKEHFFEQFRVQQFRETHLNRCPVGLHLSDIRDLSEDNDYMEGLYSCQDRVNDEKEKNEEREALKNENTRLKEEVINLGTTLGQMNRTVRVLNNDLVNETAARTDLQKTIAAEQEKVQGLQTDLSNAQNARQADQANVRVLQNNLNNVQTALNNAQATFDQQQIEKVKTRALQTLSIKNICTNEGGKIVWKFSPGLGKGIVKGGAVVCRESVERFMKKAGGKAVPFISVGIGSAAAYYRYQNRQPILALGEFASGVVGAFPAVGYGSIGLDAGILCYDIDQELKKIMLPVADLKDAYEILGFAYPGTVSQEQVDTRFHRLNTATNPDNLPLTEVQDRLQLTNANLLVGQAKDMIRRLNNWGDNTTAQHENVTAPPLVVTTA